MDPRLLDILCCPLTRLPLRALGDRELALLNQSIGSGTVRCGNGTTVSQPIEAALVTRDGSTIYRIDDGIPVLLADEAIAASQLAEQGP